MTGSPRPRRIALIDRSWAVQWSVLLATPMKSPPIVEIRAVLGEFMRRNPAAPIASRLDGVSGRWRPVPAAELEAHLDCVLISAADPDPADFNGYIATHLAAATPDLPVFVVVTPGSILLQISHAVGDAVTLTQLMLALAQADATRFAALEQRTETAALGRALLRGLRPHHRDWTHYVRHRGGPPASEISGPAMAPRPAFAGTVLSNASLRDITRWRNANARGVSLTSVLTSLAYQTLLASGVRIHNQGYYSLLDMRSLLPETADLRLGNLCKSLYLAADLSDPIAVEAALKKARETRRALPAAVLGAAIGAVTRLRAPTDLVPATTPVTLTFNSMPALPGISDMPWLSEANRRFYGFGPSLGSGGITVFAVRLRDHMELTATFDETTVSTETVRHALEAMSDPAALVTGLTVRT